MENVFQIDSSFFYRPSTMVMLWILIFTSDRLMNYVGVKLYYGRVKHFLLFEDGYHLKSISEYEIGHPGGIIAKFLSELIISTTGVWILLYSCRLLSSWSFYEFFCGTFVLFEACIHFRHMRNVSLFSLAKKDSGLYGCIAIPKWIRLRNNFMEFIIFSLSYLVIFFFDTSNYFVLGGALSCLFASLSNLIYAQKEKKTFIRKNLNSPREINAPAI
ncbi:MAG: hypothetical protein WCS96_04030 [Victivallales bacterium]|jgi:hypothetical protein